MMMVYLLITKQLKTIIIINIFFSQSLSLVIYILFLIHSYYN